MPKVALEVNGRPYSVACRDGEEERIRELGRVLDHKVKGLVASVGQVGEAYLLLLAALQLADELADRLDENETLRSEAETGLGFKTAVDLAGRNVGALAERLEKIAAALEKP